MIKYLKYLLIVFILSGCSKKSVPTELIKTDSVNKIFVDKMNRFPGDYTAGEFKSESDYDYAPRKKSVKKITPQKDVESPNQQIPDSDMDGVSDYLDVEPNQIINTTNSNNVSVNSNRSKKNNPSYGRLVYDIPDTMLVHSVYNVVVRIAKDKSDMTIVSGLITPVDTVVRVSEVMDVMIVDPCGGCFKIVKSIGEQSLDSLEYTEWIFNITPLKSGNSKLNLVVYVSGSNKQIVYTDDVVVKTTTKIVVKGFWEKYWQWFFTTLILPIFLWIKNKKKKSEQK